MKKVALACQKGGVGKSTLALHLMALAAKAGTSAAVHDADPQESCMRWSARRQRLHGAAAPVYREPVSTDLLIVDTPPHANAALHSLIAGSDLVLIPTRPGGFDLESAMQTVDVVKALGLPLAIIIALPAPRMPEIIEANTWLKGQNLPLAGLLHHRVDVMRAVGQGLTIDEYEPGHLAAREFTCIYDYMHTAIN